MVRVIETGIPAAGGEKKKALSKKENDEKGQKILDNDSLGYVCSQFVCTR